MWLINAINQKLEYFVDERQQPYAILSHTWGADEVTFEDMQDDGAQAKPAYQKISNACRIALVHNLSYVWVDTCCIDKSSSAELSEAINAMFSYYHAAEICYVFLSDAPEPFSHCEPQGDPEVWQHERTLQCVRDLGMCRWFTRGWTLQELLAPRDLQFYGPTWTFLGDKVHLAGALGLITCIDQAAIDNFVYLDKQRLFSAAKKMSWASNRSTTRVEDRACFLLGLFNVNMPLIYGEGRNASTRLQEEIIRTCPDHSIFAWHYHLDADTDRCDLLAHSPDNFTQCSTIEPYHELKSFDSHRLSNQGLEIQARIWRSPSSNSEIGHAYAILRCRYGDDFSGPVGLCLRQVGDINSSTPVFCIRENGILNKSWHGRIAIVPYEYIAQAKSTPCVILKSMPVTAKDDYGQEMREGRLPSPPRVWIRLEDSRADWSDLCAPLPLGRWIGKDVFVPATISTEDSKQTACEIFAEEIGDGQNFALAFSMRPDMIVRKYKYWKDYDVRMGIGRAPQNLCKDDSNAAAKMAFAKALLECGTYSNEVTKSWPGWKTVHARAERAELWEQGLFVIIIRIQITDCIA